MSAKMTETECVRALRRTIRVQFTLSSVICWLVDGSCVEFYGSMDMPARPRLYSPDEANLMMLDDQS